MISISKREILLMVIVILLLIVFSIIKCGGNHDNKYYEMLIAEKDSQIAVLKSDRKTLEQTIEAKEINQTALEAMDSILNSQNEERIKTYKLLNEKLQNIPSFIKFLAGNDDSLRAAFSNFR